jgi:tetratricopeptide (TPR) repeat protein
VGDLGHAQRGLAPVDGQLRAYELVGSAQSVFEKLVKSHPDRPEYRAELAGCLNRLGTFQHQDGELDAAGRSYEQARVLYEQLATAHPARAEFREGLAKSWSNLGVLHSRQREKDQAAGDAGKALELRRRLVEEAPENATYQTHLADSYANQGTVLFDLGRRPEAEASLRTSLDIRKRLAQKHPQDIDYQEDLARTYHTLGQICGKLGRAGEADESLREARRLRAALAADNPSVTRYRLDLARTHCALGNLAYRTCLGNRTNPRVFGTACEEGKKAFADALEVLKTLPEDSRRTLPYAIEAATAQSSLANLLYENKESESALRLYDEAIQTLAGKDSADVRELLRISYWGRAALNGEAGRHEQALADWREVLRLGGTAYANLRQEAARAAEAAVAGGQVRTGAGWYDLAAVFALLSAEAAGRPEETGSQAERWAEQAVKALR